ncbi:hypothetical protein M087_1083 [Bacteroides fragilis str. S23 R14]|nr:hypothetical protein M087_1083 [Bacteroides fragilis str. S23 R14]EYA67433.1 hypothetical protein M139_1175 [Bacteroides fragilis str. S23L24]EYE46615.1 hypothetical protein M138_1157 [Bacteroides fragilis str. S23L17]
MGLGEERPGLRCEYNTTFSNTDGLGTVYMEGIYIKRENSIQIAFFVIAKRNINR